MGALESIEVQRSRCDKFRIQLLKLVEIHLDIDAPKRTIVSGEPDWVLRMRKVCLHALAITDCAISADGMHSMTTELRAAYEQMNDVWKCLPEEFRFGADRNWWNSEARNRLAAFNHPTAVSLVMPLAEGGFGNAEDPVGYLRLAIWLGRLVCGYGLALGYLTRVLGGPRAEIDARLNSVLSNMR